MVALQYNASRASGVADLAHAFGTTYWWAVGAAALAMVPALAFRSRGTAAGDRRNVADRSTEAGDQDAADPRAAVG